jgi:adenosine deaminase
MPGYIDLHRHIEGSITPFVQRRIGRSMECRWYPGRDFFAIWPGIIAYLDDPDIAAQVAYHSLEELAALGVSYAEYQISPAEYASEPMAVIKAVRSAMRRAEGDFGIPSNLIVNLTRHLPHLIERDSTVAIEMYEQGEICAAGLAGDEIGYPICALDIELARLRATHMPLTFHAGEFGGADEIAAALDFGVRRIGHGIRCLSDKYLVQRLIDQRVGLEICLTSEISLANVASISDHPVPKLLQMGLLLNINTDDPAVFSTEIDAEYRLASEILDLEVISKNAVEMAFCSEELKRKLRSISP